MPEAVTISRNALFTSAQLRAMLDVSERTLATARASGALLSTRKGRRVFYLGKWVLDWLEADADRTRPNSSH